LMPDSSPTFRHLKKGFVVGDRDTNAVDVQTAGSEKFNSDAPCTSIDSC
jgi:hypothetical protein